MIAKVELDMKFYFPVNVKISIEDRNGAVVAVGSIAEEGAAVLEIASPELWNTENPYLYKLILETENEVIVDHIAQMCIRDRYQRGWPDPQPLQPDDHGDGPDLQHGAEPPEHSDPHGAWTGDPEGLCPAGWFPVPGCRLFPDRAARPRPHVRR